MIIADGADFAHAGLIEKNDFLWFCRVNLGLVQLSLGVGFLFIGVELRLHDILVGFDFSLGNFRIRVSLFLRCLGSGVHSFFLIVDDFFSHFFVIFDGGLFLITAHEGDGDE